MLVPVCAGLVDVAREEVVFPAGLMAAPSRARPLLSGLEGRTRVPLRALASEAEPGIEHQCSGRQQSE